MVLVIIILGAFNIYLSEDRSASIKGMSLFLMSGVLILVVTFFLFKSKKNQTLFLGFFSTCFVVLIVYGLFEFFQGIIISKKQILLFSANPIPAGSLLILLATGPLLLLAKTQFYLAKNTAIFIAVIVDFGGNFDWTARTHFSIIGYGFYLGNHKKPRAVDIYNDYSSSNGDRLSIQR